MPLDLKDKPRFVLAREIGIDPAHLTRILSQQRKPGIEVAVRMAHALGVSVDELCEALGIRVDKE